MGARLLLDVHDMEKQGDGMTSVPFFGLYERDA
jgi:hypothetical protein